MSQRARPARVHYYIDADEAVPAIIWQHRRPA
jgi:hypothetical protein